MHLRAPSIAGGISAFAWAFAFGLYIWAFLLGLGTSLAMSVIVGALTLGGAFLLIRTQGVQGHLPRARRR